MPTPLNVEIPVRCRRRLSLALAGALALASVGTTRAEVIYVGTGANCDENTLPLALLRAALNGGGLDEIRLPRDTTYSNIAVHLTDWMPATTGTLVISGGYDDCNDTTRSGVTVVQGNGSDPVFEVDTSSQVISDVRLVNLEVRGGAPGVLAESGAFVLVQASRLRLNDGGIAISAGGDVEVDFASEVVENDGVTFGGGVSCVGAGARLTLYGRIAQNVATSAGGGIYATTGCLVRLRSNSWVEENQASLGGGLFLSGTARAENLGTGTANANIYANEAVEGGGIYMAGTGPQTLLGNVRIVSNTAAQRGGGVALVGGARLQLERFNFEQCTTAPRCTKVNENWVGDGGLGSAVYADGGSEFRMFQGYLEYNADVEFAGEAIYASGAQTTMHFEGIQVQGNFTESLFHAENGAEITAAFVSAAGNQFEVDGGPAVLASAGATATGGARIELLSSILSGHRPFVTASGGEIHGECLMLDATTGLTTQLSSMVGFDPKFVDAGAGDLHLRRDSPAIDSCSAAVYAPLDSDADLDVRGYDFATVTDVLGPFDRGFDEIRPLFADGFESNDTAAWSATVP